MKKKKQWRSNEEAESKLQSQRATGLLSWIQLFRLYARLFAIYVWALKRVGLWIGADIIQVSAFFSWKLSRSFRTKEKYPPLHEVTDEPL